MKKIMKILKPFLIAPALLYLFNIMARAIDIYIPINVITIAVIGFLQLPGFLLLIFYVIFIF